jgi:hypothetical protein
MRLGHRRARRASIVALVLGACSSATPVGDAGDGAVEDCTSFAAWACSEPGTGSCVATCGSGAARRELACSLDTAGLCTCSADGESQGCDLAITGGALDCDRCATVFESYGCCVP